MSPENNFASIRAKIREIPHRTTIGVLLLLFVAFWFLVILQNYFYTFTPDFEACRATYGVAIDEANACLANKMPYTTSCSIYPAFDDSEVNLSEGG